MNRFLFRKLTLYLVVFGILGTTSPLVRSTTSTRTIFIDRQSFEHGSNLQKEGEWEIITSPTQMNLNAIDAVSSTDVWAVGGERYEGVILHWDGSSWSIISEDLSEPLIAVSMIDAIDGWAFGGNQMFPPFEAILLRWNGNSWVDVTGSLGSPWNYEEADTLKMISPKDGWLSAGSYYNRVWRVAQWDGIRWNINDGLVSGVGPTVNSFAGVSPNDVWAVGGFIAKWDGTQWEKVDKPTPKKLWAIDAISTSDAWAVGGGGVILHWNGEKWRRVEKPTFSALKSISMSAVNDGWAVGRGGTIVHWDGKSWSDINSPTTQDLFGVKMISPWEGWAVGSGGTILHYELPYTKTLLPLVINHTQSIKR